MINSSHRQRDARRYEQGRRIAEAERANAANVETEPDPGNDPVFGLSYKAFDKGRKEFEKYTKGGSMASAIGSALTAIMREVGAIGKDSRNAQQNFNFRGIDAVMNHLHPIFAAHGVIVLPEVLEDRTEERQSKSGGTLIYRVLKIKFGFHAEDGSSVSSTVIGEGMDSGDKAANKAMAVALKYALTQMLLLPYDEVDPDGDTPPPSERKPIPSRPSDDTATAQAKADLARMVDSGAVKKGSEVTTPDHAPGPAAIRDEIQQGIEEIGRRTGKTAEEVLTRLTSFPGKDGKPRFCRVVSELTDKWAGSTLGKVRKELAGREPGYD